MAVRKCRVSTGPNDNPNSDSDLHITYSVFHSQTTATGEASVDHLSDADTVCLLMFKPTDSALGRFLSGCRLISNN